MCWLSHLKTTSGRCKGLKELIAVLWHGISTNTHTFSTKHLTLTAVSQAQRHPVSRTIKRTDENKEKVIQPLLNVSRMHSTTTKRIYLTVRGSGQVCSSSSMISGGSKPNRMWLHLYLTQHQSGGAFLAVSRASVRDALLQPVSRSRPLALLFLSAPPCAHTQDLYDGTTTTRKSLLMRAVASVGRTNQQNMPSYLIYIRECDWLSRL